MLAPINVLHSISRSSGASSTEGQPALIGQESLCQQIAPDDSPELGAIRERYRPLFQEALSEVIRALSERDKALLEFHFANGLNIDAIATIYRVHRATVARWLVDIRKQLLRAVQDRLGQQLGTDSSEFWSLLQVVRADLHASLTRLMGRDRRRSTSPAA